MWNLLNKILANFKECFSRQASFNWFVIIIIGLMLRSDSLGLASIIRDLNLSHSSYATMIHFFHISISTVKTHTLNIYSKLGVKNRVEAVNEGRKVLLD
ncbi:LuxR C-terminal-related transcriptional regulator [Clostridium sp.]|uniref:helix-turn-helix transcriptional regulator n=1 Tax=Clostridium sp. TaxID=1506 RepID=UPI0026017D34|nr:LuxR C-terminal-related transcriptional regulator [Clostridium sp.]